MVAILEMASFGNVSGLSPSYMILLIQQITFSIFYQLGFRILLSLGIVLRMDNSSSEIPFPLDLRGIHSC